MNTIKNLLISLLLLGFSAQVFAGMANIIKIERIGTEIIRITFDEPIKPVAQPPFPVINNISINIYTGTNQNAGDKYYVGSAIYRSGRSLSAVNPGASGYATQWQWNEADALAAMDADNLLQVSFYLDSTGSFKNFALESPRSYVNFPNALKVSLNDNPAVINNDNVTRNEGASLSALTFNVTNTPSTETLTYSIAGTDVDLFTLTGPTVTFKTAPDHENPVDNGGDNIYNLTLKVDDTLTTTTKDITITIDNINENTITINDQTRAIDENSRVDATVGVVLTTIGIPTEFSITAGNTGNAFKIDNTGQIQVATDTLDYETKDSYALTVQISKIDADDKTATITVNINDVDDIAPDEPKLSNSTILENSSIGTLVGTLSATDVDTDNTTLTYVLDGSDKDNFEIDGNQLKNKVAITATPGTTYSITIATSDGARTSNAKAFAITVIEDLAITSADNLAVNEEIQTVATLTSNVGDATFVIDGTNNDNNLFQITSGNTLQFKDVNGVDYDTIGNTPGFASRVYTVNLKASKTGKTDATKTITVTIVNIDDTPAPKFTDATKNTVFPITSTNKQIPIMIEQYVHGQTFPTVFAYKNGTKVSSDVMSTLTGNGASINVYNAGVGSNIPVHKSFILTLDNSVIQAMQDNGGAGTIFTLKFKTNRFPTVDNKRIDKDTDFFTVCFDCALTISNPATISVDENTALVTTLTTINSPEFTPTFTLSGTDFALFTIKNTNELHFTDTAGADYEGSKQSFSIVVKAAGNGEENSKTFTINLNNLNDNAPTAPTFTGSSNIPENTSAGTTLGTLASTDADSNDDAALTYSVTGANVEYFEITGNQLKLKQAVDYETITTLTITVNASDGTNTSSATNLTFNITDIDDTAPDEPNLSNSTILKYSAIGTLVGTLSAMDVDTDNATLTYVLDGSDKANFEIIGNQLKTKAAITAAAGGSYSITIASSDGTSTSSAKAFTITVTGNLAITSADTFNAPEGTSVTHTLSASYTTATFSLVENTSGLFSINGATLTFDGTAADFESSVKSYAVKVKASTSSADDGDAEQTITVNIQDVNDNAPTAPTFTGSSNIPESTSAGTTLGTLASTDADSNDGTRTYSVAGTNVEYFEITGNQLKLKQAVDYETIKTLMITVNASDGVNTSPNKSLTFNITDTDDTAPGEPNLDNSVILKGSAIGTLVGTLSAMDVDTDNTTLTYVLDGSDKANFEIIGNQLKTKAAITAAAGTTYSITIASSDGARTSSAKAFAIAVTENLTITSANAFNSDEGATTNHTLVANKNGATFSIVGSAGLFSINGTTLTFNGTNTDFESTTKSYTVKVKATTGSDADENAEQTITVNIQDVNDNTPTAPTFTGSSNIPENTSVGTTLGTLASTDADSNDAARTYSVAGTNVEYFEITGNQLKLKQAVDYETITTLTITVNASDGTNTSSATNLTFNITDIDDTAPDEPNLSNSVILKDSAIGALVGTLSAMDVDTDNATLTYVLDGSDKANFEIIGNQLKTKVAITIAADTTYSITIASSDGARTSSAKAFTITVTEDLAITSANTFNAPEGTSVTHTLSASDTNATFSLVENTSGLFSINGATLTFNGTNTDFESTTKSYTVKVKASTGSDADENAEQTITVNIQDVNDNTPTAPTFTGSSNIPENTSAGTTLGTLASTDADSNDAARTYSVAGTNVEYFEITGNQLKLKQAVDYETITTLTITVNASDGTNTSPNKSLTFNITDTDDTAPDEPNLSNSVILKDSAIGTLVGTLSAMDVDTDNNALMYTLDGANKANFEIVGNQLKTKTTLVFGTTYNITIASSDGSRTSSAKAFTITVTEDLTITSANTFNAPEGTSVTHTLSASDTNATFSLVENTSGFFSLSGATLTFNGATTDFESTTKSYTVKVKATTGSDADENAEQTITANLTNVDEAATVNISGGGKTSIGKTVTLTANATDPDTALAYAWMQTSGDTIALSATDTKSVSFTTTRAMEGKTLGFKVTVNGVEATTTVTVNNAEVIAQAVRKESKAASKILINRVSKTVMGRLSHLRKKQGKSSDFNGLSFTNGIKVQFANSEISTAINNVLGANGLNSTIKIPTRKFNRWDAWSSGNIVIGKSNRDSNNKTRFKLKFLNVGVDRKLGQDKIIGFALGIGKENRTSTGVDFSGDIDTTQWSLSNYGSLEIDKHTSLEGIIGVVKSKHEVNNANYNQKSSGYFASIAYRGTLQKGKLDLSPYARYDINRVKMKATDVLTNSEASTDEALALGIDANHAIDYKDGKLNRFINLEYKSDLIRGNNDYISQNAEQEVTIKLGMDYQIKDTNVAINYERVQSTNNKAHSNGIEGTLHWKF